LSSPPIKNEDKTEQGQQVDDVLSPEHRPISDRRKSRVNFQSIYPVFRVLLLTSSVRYENTENKINEQGTSKTKPPSKLYVVKWGGRSVGKALALRRLVAN
jgi:hypothetical protein